MRISYHSILLSAILFFLLICVTKASKINPTFYRFRLGAIKATVVSDGNLSFNSSLWFVQDEAIRRSFQFFSTPSFPFSVPQNIVILDFPSGDRVIVDTGSSAFTETNPFATSAGKLVENMNAAGIDPASIDKIVITHAHFDHVGGLLDLQGKKTFPNAKVYISRKEHEFAMQTNVFNLPPPFPNDIVNSNNQEYQKVIAPYIRSDDLILVESFETVLPGLRFIPSPGHTDNHHCIEVMSKGRRLFITGDALSNRASNIQNPDWALVPETNQTLAYNTRIELMERETKRRDLVLVFHENFPGLGHVIRNGPWFDWIISGRYQPHAPRRFKSIAP